MDSKNEYQGMWWLPEKPENKFVGALTFPQNEGAELRIIGCFDKHNLLEPIIILGETTDGKKISLINCIQTDLRTSHPGGETSVFEIDFIFIGVHFLKIEDVKFKSLSVHFSYLDEWLDFKSLNERNGANGEIIISFKKPGSVKTKLKDGTEITIDIVGNIVHPPDMHTELRLNSKSFIIIKPQQEKSFQEFRGIIRTIQNFITLALGEEVSEPLSITGITEVNKQLIGGQPYNPPVTIINRFVKSNNHKKMMKHKMIFSFDTISHRFSAFLNTWFENASSFKTIFDLYFGIKYNPSLYVDNQFLNCIIAVEAFHRYDVEGEYLSEAEYETIRQTLVDAIPASIDKFHRQSLENRIKYGYEYSMIKRLSEITQTYEKNIGMFIDDTALFNKQVVDTRNYMIHNTHAPKESVCEGKDLIILTKKLKLLLEVLLLRKLGFTEEETNNLISKHERFKLKYIENSVILSYI
ncbi:MAG: hypothetical protein NTW30_04440 [Candidatus Aenigmarchaeota archaeon]|nr:hypothetical protein [Candidatus Aenigmarchaeota archaeon]